MRFHPSRHSTASQLFPQTNDAVSRKCEKFNSSSAFPFLRLETKPVVGPRIGTIGPYQVVQSYLLARKAFVKASKQRLVVRRIARPNVFHWIDTSVTKKYSNITVGHSLRNSGLVVRVIHRQAISEAAAFARNIVFHFQQALAGITRPSFG